MGVTPPRLLPTRSFLCVQAEHKISNSTVEARPLGSMDVSVIPFPSVIQNYILGHIIYPLK